MRKNIITILLLCIVTLGLALSGCSGGNSGGVVSGSSGSIISGVASLGTTTSGAVSIKDSSVPAQERTTTINRNGSYAVNVSGLRPPFMVRATWRDNSGNSRMYSVSSTGGRTNINPFSDTAVAAAAEDMDPDDLYARPDAGRYRRTSENLERVINSLRTVLAPLFALYQTSGNPITDDDDNENENSGLRAMFRDVRFVTNSGTVIVTSRQTGAVIFSGPLNDLSSGTFYPANMPAGTGSNACTYTYSAWGACQSDNTQTRTMLTSSPAGCTGTPILSQACVSVPPTPTPCTYTYSSWSACLSDNTQIRTDLTSSPAGCTGMPILSQACTYIPPACTYNYSVWGACQSNNTQTRTMLSSSPTGCTGTPVLSQSCTYVPPVTACTSFTYSAWGTCTNGTQTRTVLTSLPAGCTGGTPALSQSCTPPTPVCGSCHAIPPSTGKHSFHVSSMGYACSTCHGAGYSSTAVTAATHSNGVKDVVSTLNYNATTGTCGSPGCHGSRSW
jgi:hypothetical protein